MGDIVECRKRGSKRNAYTKIVQKRPSARDLIRDAVHSSTASMIRASEAVPINDVEAMQRAIDDGTISKADRRLVDDVMRALGVLCANWEGA